MEKYSCKPLEPLLKNECDVSCFPVNFSNFSEELFHRTPPAAASVGKINFTEDL